MLLCDGLGYIGLGIRCMVCVTVSPTVSDIETASVNYGSPSFIVIYIDKNRSANIPTILMIATNALF